MAIWLILAAVMVTLGLVLSGEASAEDYICGKVFWNEAEHDSGATDITIWAKAEGDAEPHMTVTDCCGEYAFTGLNTLWEYKVWGLFGCITADPCQISGSECWEMVELPSQDADPGDIHGNCALGIDCANAQVDCDDPCPE